MWSKILKRVSLVIWVGFLAVPCFYSMACNDDPIVGSFVPVAPDGPDNHGEEYPNSGQ